MEKGIIGTREIIVTSEMTAAAVDAMLPAVYATPCLLSEVELTAAKSIAPYLEDGQTSCGTIVNLKHMAATPVGMKVRIETELVEVDRKRLEFVFKAFDEVEQIAEGTHQRFIIKQEKFNAAAAAKAAK